MTDAAAGIAILLCYPCCHVIHEPVLFCSLLICVRCSSKYAEVTDATASMLFLLLQALYAAVPAMLSSLLVLHVASCGFAASSLQTGVISLVWGFLEAGGGHVHLFENT